MYVCMYVCVYIYVYTAWTHAWLKSLAAFHQRKGTARSPLAIRINDLSVLSGFPHSKFWTPLEENRWIAKQSKPHLPTIEVIKTPLSFSNELQEFGKYLCCKVRYPYFTIEMPKWHAPECEIAPWKSHGLVQRCARTQLVWSTRQNRMICIFWSTSCVQGQFFCIFLE